MRQFLLNMERRYTAMHSRDQQIFPYFVFACIFLVGYFLLVSPLSRKTDFLAADNLQLEQEVYSLDQKPKGWGKGETASFEGAVRPAASTGTLQG